MPRRPRYIQPGAIYHLISRFVDRDWFIASDAERAVYLRLLARHLQRSDWKCVAYAVMSNHIHLECVAGSQSLESWIRPVNSAFADWLNRTHERIGTIFVRGPKAILAPPDHARTLIAYIHNNPVRAGVVEHARDSTWTSHRYYVGLDHRPRWLDVDTGLELTGTSDAAAFDAMVEDPANAVEIPGVDTDDEDSIVQLDPELRAAAESIVTATASELAIPIAQLCSQRRGTLEVLGRRAAVRCAIKVGVTGANIARALCMSQQNASNLARRADADVTELANRILLHL